MKKIITHNGNFHADDIFAVATLQLILEKEGFEVIRTRDEEIIKTGDFVIDVGGVYDADKNLFDHHMPEGAGERENKIPYASFGLVWKKFGKELCGTHDVRDKIDKKLAQVIDAADVGIDLFKNIKENVHPYLLRSFLVSLKPTWKEEDLDKDFMFDKAVGFAKEVLIREIKVTQDTMEAETAVIKAYDEAKDKRIIVMDEKYPWESVLNKYEEPLYVVYPNISWRVKAVRDNFNSFENKNDLPESWAGKNDEELADITGVKDAVFCHRARFLAGAKSKEGAIKLAQIALDT
ncbi:MYG1 family protein [Patescibacteria group bacterium]